jgi:type VI secretion system protein ImpH
LIELLRRDAGRFSFFQIVRLAEAAGAGEIGGRGSANDEQLRFRPELTLAHPTTDVASVERVEDPDGRERLLVETTFLGLYGTMSPLPTFYTEDLLHEHGEESLVRGFLDIFHHRLISLFYRCWKKYRHFVQFRAGARDDFSRRVMALTGLGMHGAEREMIIPPVKLLRYAGVLSQRPCSAASLRCILSDYFSDVPSEVTECVTRWVMIPQHSRCRLGRSAATLGVDMQLGERMLDRSGKFKVELGPLAFPAFQSFLPGGTNEPILRELLRIATADLLAYDVELELMRAETPQTRLAERGLGSRLGQTSWLGSVEGRSSVVLQSYGERPVHPSTTAAVPGAVATAGV